MNGLTIQERAFFKLLEDIKVYLPYFVLVGGWVPYIYRNFLWKEDIPNPHLTTDIDLGFNPAIQKFPKQPIYSQFTKLNYPERHLKMDRMFPVVPLVKVGEIGMSIPVEFLTTVDSAEEVQERLIGKQIHVNRLDRFQLILENPILVKIGLETKEYKINIPTVEKFVFHKLLIFVTRKDVVKMAKDLYYAYYVLRYVPSFEVLLKDMLMFRKIGESEMVISNLNKYFSQIQSEGVLLVEKEVGLSIYGEDLRDDIYQRFNKLKEYLE